MQRLTLSEFVITIAILLILAFGASRLLQAWLLRVNDDTGGRLERAERIYQ